MLTNSCEQTEKKKNTLKKATRNCSKGGGEEANPQRSAEGGIYCTSQHQSAAFSSFRCWAIRPLSSEHSRCFPPHPPLPAPKPRPGAHKRRFYNPKMPLLQPQNATFRTAPPSPGPARPGRAAGRSPEGCEAVPGPPGPRCPCAGRGAAAGPPPLCSPPTPPPWSRRTHAWRRAMRRCMGVAMAAGGAALHAGTRGGPEARQSRPQRGAKWQKRGDLGHYRLVMHSISIKYSHV